MGAMTAAHEWIVAATIATEVPPTLITKVTPELRETIFTREMIKPAIRAVADVMRCRIEDTHFPDTGIAVVLAPRQFSAVCREDYWRRAVAGNWQRKHVEECLSVWRESVVPRLHALYYYSPISMVPMMREPSWAARLTEVYVDGINRDFFRWYR